MKRSKSEIFITVFVGLSAYVGVHYGGYLGGLYTTLSGGIVGGLALEISKRIESIEKRLDSLEKKLDSEN